MQSKLKVFSDIQDPIVYMNLKSIVDKLGWVEKKIEVIEETLMSQNYDFGDLKKEVGVCKEKLGLSGSTKKR